MLEKKQKHNSGGDSLLPSEDAENSVEDPLICYHTIASTAGAIGSDQAPSSSSCGSNSETMRTNFLQHPNLEDGTLENLTNRSSSSSLGRRSKSKDSRNSLEDIIIAEEPLLTNYENPKATNGFSSRLNYYGIVPNSGAADPNDEYYMYDETEERRVDSPIFDYKFDDDKDDIPIIPGIMMNVSSDMDSAFEDESDEKCLDGRNKYQKSSGRRRFASKPGSPPRNDRKHFRSFSSDYASNANAFNSQDNNDTWSKYPDRFIPKYRGHNSEEDDIQMEESNEFLPVNNTPATELASAKSSPGFTSINQFVGDLKSTEEKTMGEGRRRSAASTPPLNKLLKTIDSESVKLKPTRASTSIYRDPLDESGQPTLETEPDLLQLIYDPETDGEEKKNLNRENDVEDNNIDLIFNEYGESVDFDIREVPPDGGWGWYVLFGSIIVNILIPGTVKSFGILFVEFIEVFNATPFSASWIPALSYFLYSSTGPFACALAVKYSHRAVTIAGGLLASIGLMSSYYATSISYLYVSYGIVGGLGAGLAYPIGVLMVNRYFEKRRGLANGLCTSGSALGSVLVPPLLRLLLGSYGYRGAILIMGALLLNVCLAALFYAPLEKHMKKIRVPKAPATTLFLMEDAQPSETVSNSKTNSITIGKGRNSTLSQVAASMPIAIPIPAIDSRFREPGSIRRATFQIGNETPQGGDSWSLKSTDSASPMTTKALLNTDSLPITCSPRICVSTTRARHVPNSLDSTADVEALYNPSGSLAFSNMSTYPSSVISRSRLNLTAIPEDDDSATPDAESRADWTSYNNLNSAKHQLMRLSTEKGSQLMSNSQASNLHTQPGLSRTLSVASNVSNSSFRYMSTIHHGSLLMALHYNDSTVQVLASTMTLRSVGRSFWNCLTCPRNCLRKCGFFQPSRDEVDRRARVPVKPPTKFIDFSLLKDRLFIIMIISSATTAIGYTNFIILLPSYAVSMKFDKSQASLLLSVVALLDFVGRIGGAALTDLHFLSRKWFFVVGLFMSGLALSFLPLAESYEALAAFCAAFGLASGTYVGLQAVILADRLGPEKLGSSYGITLFVNGIVQLFGPPICGNILETTGAFEPIFVGLGLILLAGALIWLLLPFVDTGPLNQNVKIELLRPTTNRI